MCAEITDAMIAAGARVLRESGFLSDSKQLACDPSREGDAVLHDLIAEIISASNSARGPCP
jgi:hypothetical protein